MQFASRQHFLAEKHKPSGCESRLMAGLHYFVLTRVSSVTAASLAAMLVSFYLLMYAVTTTIGAQEMHSTNSLQAVAGGASHFLGGLFTPFVSLLIPSVLCLFILAYVKFRDHRFMPFTPALSLSIFYLFMGGGLLVLYVYLH